MSITRSTIGIVLREGRLRQRLSIAECAKNTHISPRYLEALEEERWNDLPSESHRIGFLKLYSRFLGISADDVLSLYNQAKQTPVDNETAPELANGKHTEPVKASSHGPSAKAPSMALTGPHVVGIVLVVLLACWFGYHFFHQDKPGEQATLWNGFRPRHNRLGASKIPQPQQQLRIRAQTDSWLRILNDQQLVFEGFLRTGSNKTWSGTGPFSVKVGNKDAIFMYFNEQEIDLKKFPSPVLDIKLPLESAPR